MKESNLEKLAELSERLDNLYHATMLPVPDSIHMMGIKPALPEIRDALKEIYLDEGGEDY